jgi:hypothetical protein
MTASHYRESQIGVPPSYEVIILTLSKVEWGRTPVL